MKHRLTLDYTLGEGDLAPHLDGLRQGKAVAYQCRTSGRVTFPPERVSGSNATASDWKTLVGAADILHRTDGPGGSFALVQFDGADNRAVGRIANPTAKGARARLVAAEGELPGLTLEILGGADETA